MGVAEARTLAVGDRVRCGRHVGTVVFAGVATEYGGHAIIRVEWDGPPGTYYGKWSFYNSGNQRSGLRRLRREEK